MSESKSTIDFISRILTLVNIPANTSPSLLHQSILTSFDKTWIHHIAIPNKKRHFFSSKRVCTGEAYILFDTPTHASHAIKTGVDLTRLSTSKEDQKRLLSPHLQCQRFTSITLHSIYCKDELEILLDNDCNLGVKEHVKKFTALIEKLGVTSSCRVAPLNIDIDDNDRSSTIELTLTTPNETMTHALYTLLKDACNTEGCLFKPMLIPENIIMLL